MVFETKKIHGEIVGIIDIGTYKIRVGVCEFKNNNLELIGYGEKRLSNDSNLFEDIDDIKRLSQNIGLAISKAEKDAGIEVKKIVLNIPFEDVFFVSSKINYPRKTSESKIDKNELTKIIKELETISFKNNIKKIKDDYGFEKNDLSLIISYIYQIKLDSKKSKKILGEGAKNISIEKLNVFIPEVKLDILRHISNSLNKDLIKIIPSEIALSNLFKNVKDVVIIDIGSCSTSLIIKKENIVKGIKKFNIGVNDLIKSISEKNKIAKIDIINSINENNYIEEKNSFLDIFFDMLVLNISGILGGEVCPETFFLTGGGSNNFLKESISSRNLNKNGLSLMKKIKFLDINDFVDVQIDEDYSKSNLNIYSMMLTSLEFIKKPSNDVEDITKNILTKIKL